MAILNFYFVHTPQKCKGLKQGQKQMVASPILNPKYFILIFTFLACLCFTGASTAQNTNTPEHFQSLLNSGYTSSMYGNRSKAMEFYIKAEMLAEKNQWKDKLMLVNNDIGLLYTNMSNYGEALTYYHKALDIAQKANILNTSSVLINLGLVYGYEKDYKTSLEYLIKAFKLPDKERNKLISAINISDVLNKMGQYEKSRKYLMSVADYTHKIDDNKLRQMWEVNLAESYFLEGKKIAEARSAMERLYRNIDPAEKYNCYPCITALLSKIYANQNQPERAIVISKRGLKLSDELPDRINALEQISKLYYKVKKYDQAFLYRDSVMLAKDSLSRIINRDLFEINKVKLDVQKYESEIKLNKEQRSIERTFYIFGSLFFVLLFIGIYKAQKNRILKQKQEKIIADKQQQIVTLELNSLKNTIAEKNRKLSAKALYLSGRNELIEEVINALNNIPQVARNKEAFEYIRTLKGYLKTDEEWDDFITYFEQVNPELLKTLKTRHPDLSTSDIRFICYVFMNLDNREIGNIFNITYNAVCKRKLRITEKMGLTNEDSLYEYLLKVVS